MNEPIRWSRRRSALLTATLLCDAAAQTAPPARPAPTASAQVAFLPAAALDERLSVPRGLPGWRSADLRCRAAQLQLDSARARAGLKLSAGAHGTQEALPWSPTPEGVRSPDRAVEAPALELRSSRAALTAQLRFSARALEVDCAQRAQGLLTESAVLERQAALEDARAAQARTARSVEQVQQALTRRLTGEVPLPGRVGLETALPDLSPTGDLERLLGRANAQRPEGRRAQWAVLYAQAGQRAAPLDARLPSITASLRAGQRSVPLRDTGGAVSGVALSLSASMPLPSTVRGAALTQAELGTQQAHPALEAAQQAVELDVQLPFSVLQDEGAALHAAQTCVSAATLNVQAARARLDAGLNPALDAALADLALQQAQQDPVALDGAALAPTTAHLDPLLLTLPTSLPSGGRP
ncbi:TolC family protein (plasmid) [Deinococcus taeanensis]|uniref:TolC family protein n=1 Tax=Deinococcus taeanensis TaxID=2737050 RepID=UPI001CDB93DC|nr:TolC family protein [Deinococcus taeanensis]UBV44889.1 TolC family protein [Deinococcus taeanensis]